METLKRIVTNPQNVLSYALGFVVAWFGLNEILAPQEWVTFAPPFLGTGTFALTLVVIHGVILATCAVFLFTNLYRRVAGAILALIFLEVIVDLVIQTGLSDIAVRDIGLCGMSLGLALFKNAPVKH